MDWTKWFSKDGDPEEQRNAPQPEDAAPVGEQPEAPAAPSADPAAPAKAPSVKDYITQKYGLADTYSKMAGDDSTVDAARAGAADDKRRARTIEGLSTMFAGRKHTDSKFYDGLAADADAKVAGAQKDKAGKLSDFLTTDKLVGEETDRGYKAADESEKARERDVSARGDNPKSPESQALRDFVKQVSPKLANTPGFENASYSQLQKAYTPLVKMYEEGETRKQVAREKSMDAAERAKDRESANADKKTHQEQQDLGAAQTKMNAEVKPIRDQLDMANRLDDEITAAQTNPEAKNILPISLARSAVGSGRINQQEISALGGSKAVLEKAQQIAQEWSKGTLTPENYKYMADLAALTKKSAQSALDERTTQHAKQYSVRTGKPLADSYTALTGGDELPKSREAATPGDQAAPAAAGEIRRKTADGRTAVYDSNKQFLRWEQ